MLNDGTSDVAARRRTPSHSNRSPERLKWPKNTWTKWCTKKLGNPRVDSPAEVIERVPTWLAAWSVFERLLSSFYRRRAVPAGGRLGATSFGSYQDTHTKHTRSPHTLHPWVLPSSSWCWRRQPVLSCLLSLQCCWRRAGGSWGKSSEWCVHS